MKIYILTFLFFLINAPIFSQNKKDIIDSTSFIVDTAIAPTKTTNEFRKLDNFFSFGQFTFNSNWANVNSLFDIQTEDDLSKYPYKDLEVKNAYLFHYNFNTKINNYEFDDIFLSINKSFFYSNSELKFYKIFESNIEAELFYKNIVKFYFRIESKITEDYYFSNGKNINLNVNIDDKVVNMKISSKYNTYKKSLLYSYDYYFLSDDFKEIDIDNTFRGIKFGTLKSVINSSVKSSKTNLDNTYALFPKENKYLNWKGITFNDGGCGLFFSKDFKFAEVRLGKDCYNDEDYDNFLKKLIAILGTPSYNFNGTHWIGKNISIFLPSKRDEEINMIILYISSNFLNVVKYKDF